MTRVGRACAGAAVIVGVVTVASWNSAGSDTARRVPAADGSQLFHAKGCAGCHDGPGSTAFAGDLPSLADAGRWAGQRRPGVTAADYLAESMRSPSAFISPAFSRSTGPTTGMPLLRLTEREIDAIVEFLLGAQ
jgi:mono/diheme cytochrome c family protein